MVTVHDTQADYAIANLAKLSRRKYTTALWGFVSPRPQRAHHVHSAQPSRGDSRHLA
jgi:hypothetical protein